MLTLVRQPQIRKPLDPRVKAILVERGERRMGAALIGSVAVPTDNSPVKRVQAGSAQWASLTLNGWVMTSIEHDIAVMERI